MVGLAMRDPNAITCAEEAKLSLYNAFPRASKYQECFFVLLLNTRNAPIGKPRMIAMGTVNSVEVSVRDVYRDAIKRNAVSIIVAHNHPSNDSDPSAEDRRLTARLVAAGDILGIKLLDHLIITSCTITSFALNGWL